MPQTPNLTVAAMIMITVVYGVIVGIESLCRASEILFPLMLLGLITAIILLFITRGVIKFPNLLPAFENGITYPIVKGWPLITFPFGELVVFTMIFKTVNEPHKIKKYAIAAVITEGVVLATINMLFITVLGVTFASIATFPLLETLRLIKIGGFLERLDILIIVTMVVAGFMKISYFMYFGILGITQLFKLKERKFLCFTLGILIWISSDLIARNFPQHLKLGLDITVKYIHLPMQIGIPVLALLIAWFKNKSKSPQTAK
jgi:spore germination protein KB